MNIENKTRNLVLAAVFMAIIIIMAFTPFGYIPLGFMNATIIHVPVIIGAIILGPKYGGFLGLVFGITSLWKIRTCRMPPRLCSPRLSKSESTAEISGAW